MHEARPHLPHFTETHFATLPRVTAGFPAWSCSPTPRPGCTTPTRPPASEPLEPVSGLTPWNAFAALWPIDIALAQLCIVLGDHARAHAHLDAAEEICERNDVPAHRIRVNLHRAWALRDAGEPVDAGPALAAADASPCAGVAREARLMGFADQPA